MQPGAGIKSACREQHEHMETGRVYGFHSLKKACGTMNAARLPEAVLNAIMRHASRETPRKYSLNKQTLIAGQVDSMYVPPIVQQGA